MRIVRKIKEMALISQRTQQSGKGIGFVPTMGALHKGHLSLVRRACKENDTVIVSIFVNPAQFGPAEDFTKYPRNLRRDAQLCRREGVDIIFYPDAKEMYPLGYKTYVIVEDLSNVLCGRSRPGHFKAVATVVTKLFNIVQPDIAYFGQKDAQQAIIIERFTRDLNIPLKIKIMPTVREKDGLAMSSRNTYLNTAERRDARILSQSLKLARDLIRQGTKNPRKIIRLMIKLIEQKKSAKIDYVSIVDLENLKPIKRISGRCLVAVAVWVGKTRLIDNIIVELK